MKLSISKTTQIDLDPVDIQATTSATGRHFSVRDGAASANLERLVNSAARSQFELPDTSRAGSGAAVIAQAERVEPSLFRDRATGFARLVYKEVVIGFAAKVPARQQQKILDTFGLARRSKSRYSDRIVAHDPKRRVMGDKLIEVSNKLNDLDEVELASPNFVSEFQRRAVVPSILQAQWHLARTAGSAKDAGIDAAGAWQHTLGKRSIVVAILDDGVDVEHKNLRKNIARKVDENEPRDLVGRDFFIPDDDHPDHYDPRPKLFRHPFANMQGNDIHGTPCAGVACARGDVSGVLGIAPRCRLLPVKVFHADDLASEARVADAIAYSGRFADVLSCSWSGPPSALIENAMEGLARGGSQLRRGRLGTPILFAAGNDGRPAVSYPASSPNVICVGASTDRAEIASYSNSGKPMWICAPSNGGAKGITTTDVSLPNRGFNIGSDAAGGSDGLHTNDFGGTSSATPLVAGVVALILSVRPDLTLAQIRDVLRTTAVKIGKSSDYLDGHSKKYGWGRIDAAAAVAAAKALPKATS